MGWCVYDCAPGPPPTIPSGPGHKYHSVSQGPGVGAVPANVGMTTRAKFPKARLSQAAGGSGSEQQAAGGASLQRGSGLRGGCPLPTALAGSTKRGKETYAAEVPRVPRDRQGTVGTTEPPGCPPSPPCREATWCGPYPSPVGGYLVWH